MFMMYGIILEQVSQGLHLGGILAHPPSPDSHQLPISELDLLEALPTQALVGLLGGLDCVCVPFQLL